MEVAARCQLYYEPLTLNTTAGTQTYTLGTTVIDIDPESFRYTDGTNWFRLTPIHREEAFEYFGLPEDQTAASRGTSSHYSVLKGHDSSAGVRIDLWPVPAHTQSPGVRYDAWVAPTVLSADGDIPEMQPYLHYAFGDVVCYEMATHDASRGQNARLDTWAVKKREAIEQILSGSTLAPHTTVGRYS
jgi:hypothetical protein